MRLVQAFIIVFGLAALAAHADPPSPTADRQAFFLYASRLLNQTPPGGTAPTTPINIQTEAQFNQLSDDQRNLLRTRIIADIANQQTARIQGPTFNHVSTFLSQQAASGVIAELERLKTDQSIQGDLGLIGDNPHQQINDVIAALRADPESQDARTKLAALQRALFDNDVGGSQAHDAVETAANEMTTQLTQLNAIKTRRAAADRRIEEARRQREQARRRGPQGPGGPGQRGPQGPAGPAGQGPTHTRSDVDRRIADLEDQLDRATDEAERAELRARLAEEEARRAAQNGGGGGGAGSGGAPGGSPSGQTAQNGNPFPTPNLQLDTSGLQAVAQGTGGSDFLSPLQDFISRGAAALGNGISAATSAISNIDLGGGNFQQIAASLQGVLPQRQVSTQPVVQQPLPVRQTPVRLAAASSGRTGGSLNLQARARRPNGLPQGGLSNTFLTATTRRLPGQITFNGPVTPSGQVFAQVDGFGIGVPRNPLTDALNPREKRSIFKKGPIDPDLKEEMARYQSVVGGTARARAMTGKNITRGLATIDLRGLRRHQGTRAVSGGTPAKQTHKRGRNIR